MALERLSATNGRHRRIVDSAKRLLAENLAHRNRISDVAASLGISEFHFARIFQRQTGTSLHRFLLRLRMAQALLRLERGEDSISRIALDLGFSSHSHFAAVFKRHFGRSPSVVRAAASAPSDGPSR